MKTKAKGKSPAGRKPTELTGCKNRIAVRVTDEEWSLIVGEMADKRQTQSTVVLQRLFGGTRKNPTLKQA